MLRLRKKFPQHSDERQNMDKCGQVCLEGRLCKDTLTKCPSASKEGWQKKTCQFLTQALRG